MAAFTRPKADITHARSPFCRAISGRPASAVSPQFAAITGRHAGARVLSSGVTPATIRPANSIIPREKRRAVVSPSPVFPSPDRPARAKVRARAAAPRGFPLRNDGTTRLFRLRRIKQTVKPRGRGLRVAKLQAGRSRACATRPRALQSCGDYREGESCRAVQGQRFGFSVWLWGGCLGGVLDEGKC